ncbi:MAG: hypothetical protein AAB649_05940 [Patescibacteria group bacterium]
MQTYILSWSPASASVQFPVKVKLEPTFTDPGETETEVATGTVLVTAVTERYGSLSLADIEIVA